MCGRLHKDCITLVVHAHSPSIYHSNRMTTLPFQHIIIAIKKLYIIISFCSSLMNHKSAMQYFFRRLLHKLIVTVTVNLAHKVCIILDPDAVLSPPYYAICLH